MLSVLAFALGLVFAADYPKGLEEIFSLRVFTGSNISPTESMSLRVRTGTNQFSESSSLSLPQLGLSDIMDSYPDANLDNGIIINRTDPSNAASYNSRVGFSFTGNGEPLNYIRVAFGNFSGSSTTVQLLMKVEGHSGVYGTSSVPNGTLIATSNGTDYGNMQGSIGVSVGVLAGASYNYFLFIFPTHPVLQNGVYYTAYLYSATSGFSSANYMRVGVDSSSPSQAGNAFVYINGAYVAVPTMDMIFEVWGASQASPVTYGAISASNTQGGRTVTLSCPVQVLTNGAISGYVPSWNNSGSWVNGSFVSVGAQSWTAQLSGTWNLTGKIGAKFYANNSAGSWSASDITYFTLTSPTPPPTPPPQPPPEPPTVGETVYIDYYFIKDTQTVNNVTGYAVSQEPPVDSTYVSISTVGSANVSWGFRVFIQNDGDAFELTDGTPQGIVTQSIDGEATLTANFTFPEARLIFGESALRFMLYSRWNSGAWSAEGVFITESLFYKEIAPSSAQFFLYCGRVTAGGTTTATFYWGATDYLSGLDGVAFVSGGAPDWQSYYLRNGNPTGFLVAPYTAVIGNTFYAIVLFGVCMSLYIRYRTLSIIVLIVVLLGGAGGVINLLVGELFTGFLWVIVAFGIGLIYWRLFR